MSRPVMIILRALGLGDLLTAAPALRALADAFPDHERVLAAPSTLEPLARCAGAVSRVLDARSLDPLPWSGPRPDVAVNLHGEGPQSHAALRAVSARRLLAFSPPEPRRDERLPRYKRDEHEVARWCRMLRELGVPADPARLDVALPEIGAASDGAWRRARGATIVHPGAASPARRWPADRWAEVARALLRDGHDVVITGGPDEVELAREVAAGAGARGDAVLAGRTSVMDLARAVAIAGRVACGDTGIAHLATALRCPSVVLCGPVAPSLWGPPPDRPWHRALWAGLSGDPHAREPDAGLLRLSVSDVLRALSDLPEPARMMEERV